MADKYQTIIDEFFLSDGTVLPNGKRKRSMLLAIKEDIKFNILLPGKWRPLNLSEDQHKELKSMLPSFTVALLFCSAVDLLARIVNKQQPPANKNGEYFKNCAKDWFDIGKDEAEQLWLLRNALTHHYALNKKQILIQFGSSAFVKKNSNGYWEFYLHAMYSGLTKASRKIHEHLSNETPTEKQKTADYLSNHAFFYTT